MKGPASCLYSGEVVHRRVQPVRHELRYRVFNLFADVDELPQLAQSLKLFSYNRFNLFSIADKNHGAGDGSSLRDHAWSLVKASPAGEHVSRIFMFCYPRVLGYVFNPLTVYYGYDSGGAVRLMIYEVNNTFGGRHSYVLPVKDGGGQSSPKQFYVSPFNAVEGEYRFQAAPPSETMALGISLRVADAAVLNAYVSGRRKPLSDSMLLRSFAGIPFLTFKVIAAIHWQAARLWLKGLRIKPRPTPPELPALIPNQPRHLP